MRVLLTGANGQLGSAIIRNKPESFDLIALSKEELDITNIGLFEAILKENNPDVIINSAAYTAVDKAEENQDLAFEINHKAVENIAKISKRNNKKLIHISTDYVFDGEACKPYSENDQPNPINIYGESKLKGENSIVDISPRNYLILRASWLYSIEKGSFLTKIIDLLKSNEIIKVVNDQTGTPTSCDSLSKVIYLSIKQNLSGRYNFSDNGYTTWHDFASRIKENILKQDFLKKVAKITPVTTEKYGAQARRPLYSVLDKDKILGELEFDYLHWEDALRNEINRLKET